MSRFNLRQKQRISYFEPEEPNLDEYVFCEDCGDYVFEYCAIHGPLLVIPDDHPPPISRVPLAARTIPHVFLHIAPSIIPGAGLGVFSSMTLPKGVRFGPYVGTRGKEVTSSYCWQIYDSSRKPLFVVDGRDPQRSNWMRYVNCARHYAEQNLLAYQYRGQIYYRTIKTIPRFTEIMLFYGSEFAHSLQIDLRKYNCTRGLAILIDSPTSNEDLNNNRIESKTTKIDCVKNHTDTIKETNIEGTIQTIETPKKINTDTENVCQLKRSHYTCKECNRKSSAEHLVIHNKLHDMTRQYVCDHCGYRFQTKYDVRRHILAIHRNLISEKLPKDVQNKNVSSERTLHGQAKSHIEKPYKCAFCNYRSAYNHHIKVHERIHTGEKPYKCTFCDFRSARDNDIKVHERIHTGEKPYKCKFCDYRSALNINIKRHERIHTGEKPYKCTFCDFRSARNNDIKVHERIHTGEKPYKCKFCNYRSAFNINIKRHERIHTGEKPYKCKFCDYRSAHKNLIKRHERSHTGEKPF